MWSCFSVIPNRSPPRKRGCCAARREKAGTAPAFPRAAASLERAAEGVDVGAGFLVVRGTAYGGGGGVGDDRGVGRRIELTAHGTGQALPVVHLRVDGPRNLVGQVGRADDEPGESSRAGGSPEHRPARAVAGLHTDLAGDRIQGLLRSVAGDKPGAAQMVPPQAG